MKNICVGLSLMLLVACASQHDDEPEDGISTETGTHETEVAASPPGTVNNPLPSAFSLPFSYELRSKRPEKLGGSIKWRVVVLPRDINLREADAKIADMATTRGYTRGPLTERSGGFSVGYEVPELGRVQTSFFEAGPSEPEEKGALHVTWITRKP